MVPGSEVGGICAGVIRQRALDLHRMYVISVLTEMSGTS
jgi:hypothetical protein